MLQRLERRNECFLFVFFMLQSFVVYHHGFLVFFGTILKGCFRWVTDSILIFMVLVWLMGLLRISLAIEFTAILVYFMLLFYRPFFHYFLSYWITHLLTVIHQNILNELVWFCLGIVTKMTVPLNIYKNEEVISSELHNIVARPIYYKSDRSHFIFSLAQLPFPVIVKYPR